MLKNAFLAMLKLDPSLITGATEQMNKELIEIA
jgi:hypothetical protein